MPSWLKFHSPKQYGLAFRVLCSGVAREYVFDRLWRCTWFTAGPSRQVLTVLGELWHGIRQEYNYNTAINVWLNSDMEYGRSTTTILLSTSGWTLTWNTAGVQLQYCYQRLGELWHEIQQEYNYNTAINIPRPWELIKAAQSNSVKMLS